MRTGQGSGTASRTAGSQGRAFSQSHVSAAGANAIPDWSGPSRTFSPRIRCHAKISSEWTLILAAMIEPQHPPPAAERYRSSGTSSLDTHRGDLPLCSKCPDFAVVHAWRKPWCGTCFHKRSLDLYMVSTQASDSPPLWRRAWRFLESRRKGPRATLLRARARRRAAGRFPG